MTIGEWLRHAAETLSASGCPDPHVDSRWIAEDTLGMTNAELHFQSEHRLDADEEKRLEACLSRRAEGEPTQYILESACFMGLTFHVDKRVLIPRQDTETLVESLIVALHGFKEPSVLDLCTGSGAIGLSLKTLVPQASVTLSDISRDALEVARFNAKELNVDARILHGDLYAAVEGETFDLIASNPPYIPRCDLPLLQREVRCEPKLALDGGEDGLDFYRRICQGAQSHLNPGGYLYLEVGIGEAEDVLALVNAHMNCAESGIINDLNQIPRIVWGRLVTDA